MTLNLCVFNSVKKNLNIVNKNCSLMQALLKHVKNDLLYDILHFCCLWWSSLHLRLLKISFLKFLVMETKLATLITKNTITHTFLLNGKIIFY
jgi:hypothetical protein